MNKRQIIASLNNIANTLDNSGLHKEANTITKVMVRIADEFDMSDNSPIEPRIKPLMNPKPESKKSTYLEKELNKFEQKVDDICSNSKDGKDAMNLMSNEYYRGLIHIIDYSSPKDRPEFGNRAMEIMNESLKKYNLI
jgi:hypothetical protein